MMRFVLCCVVSHTRVRLNEVSSQYVSHTLLVCVVNEHLLLFLVLLYHAFKQTFIHGINWNYEYIFTSTMWMSNFIKMVRCCSFIVVSGFFAFLFSLLFFLALPLFLSLSLSLLLFLIRTPHPVSLLSHSRLYLTHKYTMNWHFVHVSVSMIHEIVIGSENMFSLTI